MIKFLIPLIGLLIIQACQVKSQKAGNEIVLNNRSYQNAFTIQFPANGWYKFGDNLDIQLQFPVEVIVTGVPSIAAVVGTTNKTFDYFSGSGTKILVFRYSVGAGELDIDGIHFTGQVSLNGGSLKFNANGGATQDCTTTFNVPSNMLRVDAVTPVLSSVTPPVDSFYAVSTRLTYMVSFSEPVFVTGSPRFNIVLDSGNVPAVYTSGSGTTILSFSRMVQASDIDTTGITTDSVLSLAMGTIKDIAGNSISTTFPVTNSPGVTVNLGGPFITNVSVPAASTYVETQDMDFTVTFSELVNVTGAPQINLNFTTGNVVATYISGSGSTNLVFRHSVLSGEQDPDGIVVASPIVLNGGTIKNFAGTTNASLVFTSPSSAGVNVDAKDPQVTSVTLPANKVYALGETLPLILVLSENVTVTGTPRLAVTVGAATKYFTYVSGSGTSALTFNYTVGAGEVDTDGITLAGLIDLNGGTLKDAVARNAVLTYSNSSTAGIKVDATPPSILSVTPPSAGTFKSADNLDFTVNFSESVTITGTPRLALTVGAATLYANYVSGGGTTNALFRYTVQNGNNDSDGIAVISPLDLNGGTVKDSTGNNMVLTFTVPDTSAVLVDTLLPLLTSVTPPLSATYGQGQDLVFAANFNKNVVVTGTPRIALDVGGNVVYAVYTSGSGSTILTFKYSIQASDSDTNGIAHSSPISLNGGTIKDSINNNADLNFTPADTSAVLIDSVLPSVLAITPPANATYSQGENINFTVQFTKSVTITGTPRLALTVGATTVYATYVSGSGSANAVFRYQVQLGDVDSDGVALSSPLQLNGGTIKDSANNNSGLTFTAPNLSAVLVSGLVPAITSITPPSNATYGSAQNLDFSVNFNKSVLVTGTPRIALTVGASTVYANYVSGSGSAALLFRYQVQVGDSDNNGIAMTSPLQLNGGTIKDSGTNVATLTFTSPNLTSVLVDAIQPVISSMTPPTNGTYQGAQNLNFTVNFSKNVTVTGTPRLQLTLGTSTVYANYLSGSGTNALIFRYVVQNNDLDMDGIVLTSPLDLNSGALKDTFNNAAVLTFTPPTMTSVLVDAVLPLISSITPPANATYVLAQNMNFVVNFNKSVIVTGTPRLNMTVGASTMYATYVSGTGSAALTFRYTVGLGDYDTDGISLNSPLELNSGTLKDSLGNNSSLTFSAPNTSAVLVDALFPVITSVTAPVNGTYDQSQNLDFVVTYNKPVNVTGTPRLNLTVGATTVYANYLSGTGTNALSFRYTISSSDQDTNGIALNSPIDLNGGTIKDAQNVSPLLSFTSPNTAGVIVDAILPAITSVTGPSNGTYLQTQTLNFTVNFNKNVTVTGTPRLAITLGATTVYANYLSGTGTNALIFRYTVQNNDLDADGIAVASPVDLNSGTIQDSSAHSATLTFTPPTTTAVLVDGVLPTISSVTAPSNATYLVTQNLNFVVTYNKAMTVVGTPRLTLTIGAATIYANYLSGSGTTALTFRYTVTNGDYDTDGIALTASIGLNGGTIKDAVNNASPLTFTAPVTTGILVDALVPTISSVTAPANGTYQGAQNMDFSVAFNKSVIVTGTPRLALTVGAATVYANYLSGTGSATLVFRYTVQNGDLDSDGIAVTSPLQLNAGTIKDSVNTNATLTFTPPTTTSVLVDAVLPAISSVTAPTNATYIQTQNLDFTVTFNKAVAITGTPRISLTIGVVTVYANYLSGTGSANIIFRYTVQNNDLDTDGITVTSPVGLNSGTIKDSLNNNATLTFTSPTTTGVLVDGVLPTISSVTAPTNGTNLVSQNMNFVVNYNKAMTVVGTPRIQLTIGATTVYANYTSGSGTTALTFRYTVAVGDSDTDGIAMISPIQLNSGTIKDAVNNASPLTYTPPTTTGVLVDALVPFISSLTSVANGTYLQTQNLDFTATFNKAVTITGTPRVQLTIGAATVYANYLSGSGTSNIIFRYTVQNNDSDTDGITVTSPVQLNSGTIKDAGGTNATLTFTAPTTTGVLVDGVLPVISSVTAPSNATYALNSNMDFTVAFNKPITVTGSPRITMTVGVATLYATYLSGSGTSSLIFRYTVAAGNTDTDGIALTSPIGLNGGTLKDAVNNNSSLTFTSPTTTGLLVDGIVPTISSVTAPANSTYGIGQNLDFTVAWSEVVTVTGSPQITLTVGATTLYATYLSGSGTASTIFRYTVATGHLDTDGITVSSPLGLSSGTIKDAATNVATLTFTPPSTTLVKVDGVVPTISSITLPAATTYTETTNIDFSVVWSEAVTVSGSPQISLDVGGTSINATYSSGSGTSTTVFRYTVAVGDEDLNGLAMSSPVLLNSGTIKDIGTNNATLTYTVPSTSSLLVDGKAPVLSSVTPPSNGAYAPGANIDFSVTFHEPVIVTSSPRLTLTVETTTKYATYLSGSGSNTLVFRYTVAASNAELDLSGIAATTSIDVTTGTIKDAVNHNANTSYSTMDLSKVYVVYSNMKAWYDFDDPSSVSVATCGASSCATGVTDKSGAGNHITTATNPGPVYTTSGYGTTNSGYVQYNALATLSLPNIANVKYYVVAMKTQSTTTANAVIGKGGTTADICYFDRSAGTNRHHFAAAHTVKQNAGTVSTSSTIVTSPTWATSTNYLYEFTAATAFTFSANTLGEINFSGAIAGAVFLDSSSTLTAAQLDKVRDQMNAIYGSY